MNSPETNRLVAAAIREVLRQHGDIFAEIGPHKVRSQLIGRLPIGSGAIESYLAQFDKVLKQRLTIIP